MFRKSLYLASALTGALLWSVAAQAAPGQAIGNINVRSGPGIAYPVIAQSPAGAVVDIAGRRDAKPRRPIYPYYDEDPYAYYNDDPYAYPDYYDYNDDDGAYFGGFGHGGFGGHGGGFGGGFGGHGGGGGMGGGHGGGGGGGGHGR